MGIQPTYSRGMFKQFLRGKGPERGEKLWEEEGHKAAIQAGDPRAINKTGFGFIHRSRSWILELRSI